MIPKHTAIKSIVQLFKQQLLSGPKNQNDYLIFQKASFAGAMKSINSTDSRKLLWGTSKKIRGISTEAVRRRGAGCLPVTVADVGDGRRDLFAP